MNLSRQSFSIVCVALCLGGLALAWAASRDWGEPNQFANEQSENAIENRRGRSAHDPATTSKSPITASRVNVGGVARPLRDVRKQTRLKNPNFYVSNVGRSPKLNKNENPSVASVAKAIETKSHPERVSVLIPPEPFSKERFEQDPDTYLTTVEPGRVFQAAPSGPDVVPIKEIGNQYFRVIQGESVILRSRSEPDMPVTFYSPKLGQFPNKLTSITVRADKDGNVETSFKASAGTRGEIDIIASSPMNSGFAQYVVNVVLPPKQSSTVTDSINDFDADIQEK